MSFLRVWCFIVEFDSSLYVCRGYTKESNECSFCVSYLELPHKKNHVMLVGESRVPVALPAALLLWIPLQQSLLVRLGHYAHGHSQTAENVLLFRTTLAIVIISSFFSAGGAPSATMRRIAIIVQSLWPVLYLSEYRYSASIAVALSGGFLIKNGITSDSSVQLRMALLALVSVFFSPLGSILASAHSELGTCMAHACCCILFFVLAAAMWRDRASSIAADVIIFASTLMAVLALFPLCSLGPISSGAFPFARPTLCELSQCAPFSAIDRRESPASGWLSVVVPDDDPYMRYLRAGSTILGHVNTVTGLSVLPVTYAAAAVRFLRRPTPPQHPDAEPKPQIALVVGFGAGDVTNVLQNTRDATNAPAWHVDVLEVDHVATWMAATYLGAHVADGGRVISRDPAAYLRGLSQEEKESGAAADAGEDAEAPAAVYDAVIINAVRPSGAIDSRFSEDDVLKGIRRTLKIGGVAAIVRRFSLVY